MGGDEDCQVPLAPELSVTFSQPMVAVTSQSDAAATTPVKLTPTPKGKWRSEERLLAFVLTPGREVVCHDLGAVVVQGVDDRPYVFTKASLLDDRLGIPLRCEGDKIHYAYPVAVLASTR